MRARLKSLFGSDVNSSRKYLERFVREAAASLPEGARVLDAGAGDCLYRPLFDRVQYESADFCQVDKKYGDITYVCDLAAIPVEDCTYDLVLLTQVLEHVPHPLAVLRELHRVLKPGGEIWLSAPLYFYEHETPHDYFRYTQFGLRYLVQAAGFALKRLEWMEGYYGTLSFQLAIARQHLPLRPNAYGGGLPGAVAAALALLAKPVLHLFAVLLYRADLRAKHTASGHPKNYTVVAVKEDNSLALQGGH